MRKPERQDLADILQELRAQVAELSERLARLEAGGALANADSVPAPVPVPVPVPGSSGAPAARAAITEEEVLAISAALAAFFGVRMRIRSIRLMGSPAWAQQGRVSIQASHRLHS